MPGGKSMKKFKGFLETLLIKIQLLCMCEGWVKEVTKESVYYTKLKEYNIRIFKNNSQGIYVTRKNKIILESLNHNFEVWYNKWRGSLMFQTDEELYEVTTDEKKTLEIFTGYVEMKRLEPFPFILLYDNDYRYMIYNYAIDKVVLESRRMNWLEKVRLIVAKSLEDSSECYYCFALKYKDGNYHLEKINFPMPEMPQDIFSPQLLGNIIVVLAEGKASVLHTFDEVEEVEWLPAPYRYLASKGEDLYMVGVSDDIYMLDVDADDIMPLEEKIEGLEDFFVITNGNNIAIVKYEENQLVRLGVTEGIEIKLGTPFIDLNESCIKIPMKVVVEKNFS